jgi:cysteine desulfurase/selenocysteine lyase
LNIDRIRQDFPMLTKQMLCYFDNAATTFKPSSVIDAIVDYYSHYSANPGRGEYDIAFKTHQRVEHVRQQTATFIKADPSNIIFTSGTTMGINLVAQGFGLSYLKEDDEILITEGDHAANTLPWYEVAKRTGAKVTIMALGDDQRLTVDLLKKHFTTRTKILAFPEVSNVYGVRSDVKSLVAFAHQFAVIVLVDGAQAVPHHNVNMKDYDVDFYVFSAHKMCGPTGLGILYGKPEALTKMQPTVFGGGMNLTYNKQQKMDLSAIPYRFEAGTLPVASIFGLGAAIEYLTTLGLDKIHEHEMALRAYAMQRLKKLTNVILYNETSDSAIITFNIKDVFSQDAATYLNTKGIAVRSGQHCSRNLSEHLKTHGTLRWSAYFYNTMDEIDRFIEAVKDGGNYLDAYFE